MPRTSHGRPLLKPEPSRPSKRKVQRSAALNALETAEKENPDATRISRHRLGEIEDDSDEPEGRKDTDGHSNKRRKVADDRGEEEDVESGSDLEGGTWHTGVNDDDEDSDLDSDEAFGESDEEKFADFTFRGSDTKNTSAKRAKRKSAKPIDLDEELDSEAGEDSSIDEEQAEDDLGDEAIDLTAAWDMDDADREDGVGRTKTASKKSFRKYRRASLSEDSDVLSGSEDGRTESGDEESSFSVSEDELLGDSNGLRSFVESLSSARPDKKSKVLTSSQTLSAVPSQYGLPPSKLSASDLLQYVKDPIQRQSLKTIQSAERSGPETYKGGIPGKLSAPLAKRQQDRLDRGAAYEKSKETLSRWIDTVKQNRRAEHLSFPLADHSKESALGQKQLIATSQTAPVTDLEATINTIMEESGMGTGKGQSAEDQEQVVEGLAEKKMDIDEVKARRAELRMARELMFREEIRAKRVKKIKSKAFRRVHRKQRDRMEAQQRETLAAAGLLNSDDEREKQDRRRAEERMGARHRESKWAKGIKQAGRGIWDEDARAGVSDLARRDEDLRKRIEGKDVVDSDLSDSEGESDSSYDSEADPEHQELNRRISALETDGSAGSQSRLGQMAFMQRAEAARKAETDEEIRQMRLAMEEKSYDDDASEVEIHEPSGRQKFGANSSKKSAIKPSKHRNEFEAPLSDDEEDRPEIALQSAQDELVKHKKNTSAPVAVQSRSLVRPNNAVRTSNQSGTLSNGSQTTIVQRKAGRKTPKAVERSMDNYTSPSESEDEEMNPDDAKAALAASIFAGPDGLAQEFAKEKADLVQEEGDQIIDNTLPGWGNWTGAGVSKKEQKKGKGRFLTTIKGVAPEKRQDAKLDRVIINEKRVKKNGKYLATELPHPFENRQQYERSLRLPIGPEWSTVNHYQDSIKPRVLLKQGTVIRPIAKPIA